jgi:hypothetical protein
MTMNPVIKNLWTARLRSGEIPQGSAYLRMGDKRCCYGVLGDLAAEAGIIEAQPACDYDEDSGTWVPEPDGRWDYGQEIDAEIVPQAIAIWAGLPEQNPIIVVPAAIAVRLPEKARLLLNRAREAALTQLNDAEVPFGVIADIIDAVL